MEDAGDQEIGLSEIHQWSLWKRMVMTVQAEGDFCRARKVVVSIILHESRIPLLPPNLISLGEKSVLSLASPLGCVMNFLASK